MNTISINLQNLAGQEEAEKILENVLDKVMPQNISDIMSDIIDKQTKPDDCLTTPQIIKSWEKVLS